MDEYKVAIDNLEALRMYAGLHMNEIDKFLGFSKGKYARIIAGQSLELKDIIAISGLYDLLAIDILKPNLKMPSLRRLPERIRSIAQERTGKTPRNQEKRDGIYYCALILNRYFKVGEDFTNSQIKGYLNNELKKAFKGKSIEWEKSIISECILDTETTRPGKTKPENVYRFVKEIPADIVEKAFEKIGDDWLEAGRRG